MIEVALNFWDEHDLLSAVVALSKSYRVRTVQNTVCSDRPQPFTVVVEVPDEYISEMTD